MTALDLDGAYLAVIDRLVTAGFNATGDPGALPPCVLVAVPTIPPQVVGGPTVDVLFPIVVRAAPPGDAEALLAMLATGSALVDELAPCSIDGRGGVYGDPPTPAYTVTVTGSLPIC
jgi:hypothetical protein